MSCDPLGFPKSVLLVLMISGDDGVADLSLDLSILVCFVSKPDERDWWYLRGSFSGSYSAL